MLANNPKWLRRLGITLALILATPLVAGADTLVLDGQFDDWVGQPYITDPIGDGPTNNTDLTAFYWGTNPGESAIYFMFERVGANGGAFFAVPIDANNDGDFGDAEDRLALVEYRPQPGGSLVAVGVFDGLWQTGSWNLINLYSGDWGESRPEGGSRAEVSVSFADLGIDAYQTISMYALASQAQSLPQVDRAPDSGVITWTPIPILGWPGLAVVVVGFVVAAGFTSGRRRWRRS